jgi:hypothetical protein
MARAFSLTFPVGNEVRDKQQLSDLRHGLLKITFRIQSQLC